jgi:hypothetical protein
MVYRSIGGISMSYKMSGNDGRLSFNDPKDLLFYLYITYRMSTTNILPHSTERKAEYLALFN